MPTKYGKICCENRCTEVKYPQNTVIARGNCALVFMYDSRKIPIKLASTIMFAIDIDESTAAIGSNIVLFFN